MALKIDPTKPYFIKDFNDLKVELDAIVRQEGNTQTTTAGKRVHYAGPTHDVAVGGGPNSNQDYDEDDKDDDAAYLRYQARP